MRGYLILALAANLPYVGRDPQHPRPEESWLFDSLSECYLPLIESFDRLVDRVGDWRLTLGVAPTLAAMLEDAELINRFRLHLIAQQQQAGREMDRLHDDNQLYPVAEFQSERLARLQRVLDERCEGRPLLALRRLQDAGHLEILGAPLSWAYLPGLLERPALLSAQVRAGLDKLESVFGQRPLGLMLPEMGYDPGLAPILVEEGIRYVFAESHAIQLARPTPPFGIHSPIYTPEGLAVFGRDRALTMEVIDPRNGYQTDPLYRRPNPALQWSAGRGDSAENSAEGNGSYERNGEGSGPQPYHPGWAVERAERHAAEFLAQRRLQLDDLQARLARPGLVTVFFKAEFFGQVWFEGPVWLESLIRKTMEWKEEIRLTTPSVYLREQPRQPLARAESSSWGGGGFSADWLGEESQEIWFHLDQAAARYMALTKSRADASGLMRRALNLAGVELFLAQSVDCLELATDPRFYSGARRRLEEHLRLFHALAQSLERRRVDAAVLEAIEARRPGLVGLELQG